MADSLGIGGDGKKRKDRGHADHLKNPLGQRQEKHQRQLLSPIGTGQEKDAPDQIGSVLEERRQGAIGQGQELAFIGNGCKHPIKFRSRFRRGDERVTPRRTAKMARRTAPTAPVVTLGASGSDDDFVRSIEMIVQASPRGVGGDTLLARWT